MKGKALRARRAAVAVLELFMAVWMLGMLLQLCLVRDAIIAELASSMEGMAYMIWVLLLITVATFAISVIAFIHAILWDGSHGAR